MEIKAHVPEGVPKGEASARVESLADFFNSGGAVQGKVERQNGGIVVSIDETNTSHALQIISMLGFLPED